MEVVLKPRLVTGRFSPDLFKRAFFPDFFLGGETMQVEATRHQSEWKSRYWTAQEHERFLEVFFFKK